ncbi:MogA/MoaB family molybdenum cofactor biosynthesis protein [Hydrogenibacillus schlegelii]|uniref:Molybdenum cofactor biosynthesis protein B n=1 Tax=Hydrogenibacillus schlegelii TaxID=1484 RepID=A0A132N9B4_HYDSH|nr:MULTISPECIES: MogA/MoaB family molybdenum cofactor biosynthesis protein [Hydrogenibacillus]KWX06719.1 molybdenum cofactor biosynthesis protein B [Hydrogenibacillus schlegelii]OAR04003.1 molybdenum cofactor biosynthesis protein B [Hydrogenibacillus schlegelii]PTQ51007.1 MAG: Molybdenum cofactor biosynthesis protein MoaB [Hydrogenibacillus schlegelii]QZA32576.1 MogA/MoaB family molybdenum cofactor biosynthesis protein [Hydrogenibacillus sp. N12]
MPDSVCHTPGPDTVRIAVITVSDTRTPETDRSGARIRELAAARGFPVVSYAIVPDEPDRIDAALTAALDHPDVEAVVLSGGTGISARDTTVEVVSRRLEKELDGFGELFRMLSYHDIGSAAMLSRAIGGIAAGKPVFALPGSTKAVALGMEKLILPELPHLIGELRKHRQKTP